MIWFVFFALVFVIVGGLVCLKHDLPDHYDRAKRFAYALLLILVLARVGILAAELRPATCDDLPKYSALWYALGCFFFESSS